MAAKENYYDDQMESPTQSILSTSLNIIFFSELPSNLRLFSLFLFSDSNMTLKIYFSYGF